MASLPPYSFLIVLTGSVALVSLNVDPVLYTSYPFILPLWIAQTHILVIRNHMFPESFHLDQCLTAECVFTIHASPLQYDYIQSDVPEVDQTLNFHPVMALVDFYQQSMLFNSLPHDPNLH